MSAIAETRRLPAPMRVGEILDRSFSVTVEITKKIFPFLVVIAILTVFGERDVIDAAKIHIDSSTHGKDLSIIQILCKFASSIVSIYAFLLGISLGADLWCGTAPDLARARTLVSFRNVIRLIGLFLWVSLLTFIGFVLLIIPGIVYMLNRFLAQYVLLLEDCSVDEALSKSKQLMQHNPGRSIFSFSSPKWRLTGIMIVGGLVSAIPAIFLGGAVGLSSLVEETLALVLLFVLSLVASITSIFTYSAYEGLYFDLRSRFEGSDLTQEIDRLRREQLTT